MAEVTIQTSGMKTLHPRARVLRILGDELVSSETVAVIELVKNAYDADATRVLAADLKYGSQGSAVCALDPN